MKAIELTDGQCEGILKLINHEIEENIANGDGSYNTYWNNIKIALGYAVYS